MKRTSANIALTKEKRSHFLLQPDAQCRGFEITSRHRHKRRQTWRVVLVIAWCR